MNIQLNKHSKGTIAAWLFMFPFVLFYFIFTVYPVVAGFVLSFFQGSIGTSFKFAGFSNYVRLFHDSFFWGALGNTLIFVIISTPAMVIVGLMLALIINTKLKGIMIFRTIFFTPFILSIAVIASVWAYMFIPYTGLASFATKLFGVNQEILWLNTTSLAWFVILIATVWWTVGFNMILFLAGLQDIPDTLYEAATIDGAGPWKRFWNITLPSLKGVTSLIIMLQIIGGFKIFGQPFLMTGGGPGTSTRTLVMYIFDQGFRNWRSGYASTISYALFLIVVLVALIQTKLLKSK